MKTKHGLVTGCAVIVIAAMALFAGCDNGSTGGGDTSIPWQAEFVPDMGAWHNEEEEAWLEFIADGGSLGPATSLYAGISYSGSPRWQLVAKNDKPTGRAFTFTVCEYDYSYFDHTWSSDPSYKVTVTYILAADGQSFEIIDTVNEIPDWVYSNPDDFPNGTYTLETYE